MDSEREGEKERRRERKMRKRKRKGYLTKRYKTICKGQTNSKSIMKKI